MLTVCVWIVFGFRESAVHQLSPFSSLSFNGRNGFLLRMLLWGYLSADSLCPGTIPTTRERELGHRFAEIAGVVAMVPPSSS